jgi:selenocysteine lyase/cysteine desulfurase
MIDRVTFEGTTYQAPPFRFEAGTPHIAGAVGLGAAIEWFQALDRKALEAHEASVFKALDDLLRTTEGVQVLGSARDRLGAVSFTVDGAHPSDVGAFLDQAGVAVRTGHHCCQPLMARYGVVGTVRASLALHSTKEDVFAFGEALGKAKRFL